MISLYKCRFVSLANRLVITRGCQTTPLSKMSQSDLQVIHDSKNKEFYIKIQDDTGSSNKAVLQYEYLTDSHVDLHHTEVPVEFRGKGVAKVLAQTAFDHFVEKEVDMTPTCTYLQKFYKDNPIPKYRDRVKFE